MKVIFKVVDEIFRLHPEVVEDARTVKSARNYLTDLVIRELDDGINVDLALVFGMVKEKLGDNQ